MIRVEECPVCQGQAFEPFITTTDHTVTQQKFNIEKCSFCGLLITNPRPENLELYYQSDNYLSHTDESKGLLQKTYSFARQLMLRKKMNLLNSIASNKTILDYGCGTGDFLRHCRDNGWTTRGVEPTRKAREIAQRKLSHDEIWEALPQQKEAKYNIITLWHVLEHIPNPNEILKELRQHLEPDGKILIAVPNVNSWDSKHYKENWAAYDTPRHLWHFSRETITKLLSKHQFQLKKVAPLPLDAFYISLLSEQYARPNQSKLTGMISAVTRGLQSNIKAARTKEYSSLIYIFDKQ